MKGRALTTIVRPTPPFKATAESDQTLLGPVAMVRHQVVGDGLVRDNGVVDPALGIASRLRNDAERRYALQLRTVVRTAVDDDPTKLSELLPDADLVLDIWTDGWNLAPSTYNDWGYRVEYAVDLRLIDARQVRASDGRRGVVIAEGSCAYATEEAVKNRTWDQMVADGARLTKDELAHAERFCGAELESKVLGFAPEAAH